MEIDMHRAVAWLESPTREWGGQAGNTAALKLPWWIVVAIKIGDQTSLINKYEVGR